MNKTNIMKDIKPLIKEDPEYQGLYGKFRITLEDKNEVKCYRIALLCCGLSFSIGMGQWLTFGSENVWVWLILMFISLSLALQWIHIYIKAIHLTLQILCLLGSLSITILIFSGNPQDLLYSFSIYKLKVLLMGPFFAALTGLGFKEFFCFRQPEAIGLTFLIPISILGYSLGIISPELIMICLSVSAMLLLILGIRKFGMDPSLDIGDKSVFEYLNS